MTCSLITDPETVLATLAAALAAGMAAARRRFRSLTGAAVAVEGTLLSIGCWMVEVISLHATHSILYHHVGPLMIVSFVWLLTCAMTIAGILKAGFGRAETAGPAGMV